MGSLCFFILFINVTTVSFVFWMISLCYSVLSVDLKSSDKFSVFECGFLTINKLSLSFPINSILLCLLIILYEVEFVYSIPLIFNHFSVFFFSKTYLFLFLVFLISTLILDFFLKEADWVY